MKVRRTCLATFLSVVLLAGSLFTGFASGVEARGSSKSSDSSSESSSSSHKSHSKSQGVSKPSSRASNYDGERDQRGRIKRSPEAKKQFLEQTGYPHGRPGYVVDHIVPLACGGKDDPSNMQWQTKAEGKAKDKVERKGC